MAAPTRRKFSGKSACVPRRPSSPGQSCRILPTTIARSLIRKVVNNGRRSVRVRVGVLAFLVVRSFLSLRVEALAASAGGPVVRVTHEEAAPRDALGVVDARAVQVFLAVAVDQDLQAMNLDDVVVLMDVPIEREPVAEAGAAAAGHVHTEICVVEGA